MPGLEVIVRPVVFPDIRPRARQSLPPQDNPDEGFAVIKGQPAQTIGLSSSHSVGTSQSRPVETERRVDVVRVYQKGGDGGDGGDGGGGGGGVVNKKNFVDVEVANRITMREPAGGPVHGSPGSGAGGPEHGGELATGKDNIDRKYFYRRTRLENNIDIMSRDQIRTNDGGGEGE